MFCCHLCKVESVIVVCLLQASTFQMAILLQFNTLDSLTVAAIQDNTQIKLVSYTKHLSLKVNQTLT